MFVVCSDYLFKNITLFKGSNKDEKSLIRIVVSRCEIDMVFIKTEYQKRFKEPLEDAIKVGLFIRVL